MEIFQSTIDDYLGEKRAIMKEKEEIMTKYVKLKEFIPFYEQIEKTQQKFKYINEMKERCSKDDFLNYIYQFSFIQQNRVEELTKKVESLQSAIE